MSATIYTFPKATEGEHIACKMPLNGDLEIEAVLTCVNVFSTLDGKVNYQNISELDPKIAIICLETGVKSWIFSEEFKKVFQTILSNVEC